MLVTIPVQVKIAETTLVQLEIASLKIPEGAIPLSFT